MKKILKKVTLTGADDSISPSDLVHLSNKYPFVEWGVLVSRSSQGEVRYPSTKWRQSLFDTWKSHTSLHLSCHICGAWMRHICDGNWSILKIFNETFDMFERLQFNFKNMIPEINEKMFFDGLDNDRLYFKQFIFQCAHFDEQLLQSAKDSEIDAVGLFDLSGGRGTLPTEWPTSNGYCGYAGGLSPINLKEQLTLIENKVDHEIWIDAETHLRSENDSRFDLNKVEDFLKISSEWVKNDLL